MLWQRLFPGTSAATAPATCAQGMRRPGPPLLPPNANSWWGEHHFFTHGHVPPGEVALDQTDRTHKPQWLKNMHLWETCSFKGHCSPGPWEFSWQKWHLPKSGGRSYPGEKV